MLSQYKVRNRTHKSLHLNLLEYSYPLMRILITQLFLCWSLSATAAFGAADASPAMPLIERLHEHYRLYPNESAPDKPITLDDLPKPLRRLTVSGDTTELTLIAEHFSNLLLPGSMPAEWTICPFLIPESRARYHNDAWTSLQNGATLRTAQQATATIYRYLDWYPGDDWHQRFEQTGFYGRIRGLREQFILLNARRLIILNSSPRDIAAETRGQIQSSLTAVKRLEASQLPPERRNIHRLALIQLRRLLDINPANAIDLHNALEQALNQTQYPDVRFELHLESLHLARQQQENRDQLKQRIAGIRQWLNENRNALSQPLLNELQLLLWEYRNGPQDDSARRRHLSQLYKFVWLHPEYSPIVIDLMGDTVHRNLNESSPAADQLAGEDDTVWLATAYYYLRAAQPNRIKAEALFSAYLASRPATNSFVPLALYETGRLQQNNNATNDSDNHVQLIWRHPNWTASLHPVFGQAMPYLHDASAANLATERAVKLWTLYLEDKRQYREQALAALTLFVGGMPPEGNRPAGPYADNERAKQFRFHLGWLLYESEQYDKAARMFAAVTESDRHYDKAQLYGIHCLQKLLLQAGLSEKEQLEKLANLLEKLTLILPRVDDRHVLLQTTQNMIELYLRTRQYQPATAMMRQFVRDYPDLQPLQEQGLYVLTQMRPEIMQRHARGDMAYLTALLPDAMELANAVWQLAQNNPDETCRTTAGLTTLEYISCYALALASQGKKPETQKADRLIEKLEKNPALKNSLRLVRCRAQLQFAKENYVESQQLWYRIRQSIEDSEKPGMPDAWWEARFYGLECLRKRGREEQARHIVEVLIKTHADEDNAWKKRIQKH